MEDFVKGHKLGGDGFLSSIVMSPPTSDIRETLQYKG